jgi:hypothetical protein
MDGEPSGVGPIVTSTEGIIRCAIGYGAYDAQFRESRDE